MKKAFDVIWKVALGTVTYFAISFAFVTAFYDKIMGWSLKMAKKSLSAAYSDDDEDLDFDIEDLFA